MFVISNLHLFLPVRLTANLVLCSFYSVRFYTVSGMKTFAKAIGNVDIVRMSIIIPNIVCMSIITPNNIVCMSTNLSCIQMNNCGWKFVVVEIFFGER